MLGLFSFALITRYLGLEVFGKYTTIITFLSFFAVAADLGLTLVSAQMISEGKYPEKKIIANLFAFRLVSILAAFAFLPFITMLSPYSAEIKEGIFIAAISFIFPALNQVLVGLLQNRLRMDYDVLGEIIGRFALIGGIIISQKLNSGLNGIIIATVIAAAINFFIHLLTCWRFSPINLEYDKNIWRLIASRSWPIAITTILNLIYLRADTLALSLFRGDKEVGLYGASYRVIDVLTTLPFMFAGLMLPIMSRAINENRLEYFKRLLQKSLDLMLVASLPLLVGTYFLGKDVMVIIAGEDFYSVPGQESAITAAAVLQLLMFAVFFVFIGTILSHAVIALGKQKKTIPFYIFTSLSSLLAYFWLIPRFSYWAAAGITIYSEALIAIFNGLCVYKTIGGGWRPERWLKTAAASIAMGLLLFFWPFKTDNLLGLGSAISIASLAYFILLMISGAVKKEELKEIINSK